MKKEAVSGCLVDLVSSVQQQTQQHVFHAVAGRGKESNALL